MHFDSNMYSFVSRDNESSVYQAVSQYLTTNRSESWKRLNKNRTRFNLLFGERNNLSFARIGTQLYSWELWEGGGLIISYKISLGSFHVHRKGMSQSKWS